MNVMNFLKPPPPSQALPADKQFLVFINPIYSFIELIRPPMIGQAPPLFEVCLALGFTVLGIIICFTMFARYRARIIYWV